MLIILVIPLLEHVLDFQKNNSDSKNEFFEKHELDTSKNIILITSWK